jgi:colanic acid biosynthesis glycosyl transferase WcaI
MRILIHSLNFSPEPTGVGKYTSEMAQWLAEQGHEIGIVTAPPHYPQYRIFNGYSSWRFGREKHASESGPPGTIEVFRCPLWVPREPRGWKRILHLMSFSLSSWPVMLRRVGWKPDVVLLLEPTICCSPGALTLARLCGAIAWLHGPRTQRLVPKLGGYFDHLPDVGPEFVARRASNLAPVNSSTLLGKYGEEARAGITD